MSSCPAADKLRANQELKDLIARKAKGEELEPPEPEQEEEPDDLMAALDAAKEALARAYAAAGRKGAAEWPRWRRA